MKVELIKKEFDNYVKEFDNSNRDINYKYRHSYRVYKLSEQIAKKMNLNDEDVILASIIGFLHDIGRFEQLKEFSSYSDINLDHGEFGAKILFEYGLIDRFKIEKKYYDIIKFAIRNHNKYEVEKTRSKRKMMFAKIIRDADKLDILRAYTIYNDYNLKTDEKNININVEKEFYGNKLVKNSYLQSKNDVIVSSLAMIFDINDKNVLNIIKSDKLVDKFYEKLENKQILRPYFDYMNKYLKE